MLGGEADFFAPVDLEAGAEDADEDADEARGVAAGALDAETARGRAVGVGAWRTRGSTRFIQIFSSRSFNRAEAAESTVGVAALRGPERKSSSSRVLTNS